MRRNVMGTAAAASRREDDMVAALERALGRSGRLLVGSVVVIAGWGRAAGALGEPCPPVVRLQVSVFESDVVVDEAHAGVGAVDMRAPTSICSARIATSAEALRLQDAFTASGRSLATMTLSAWLGGGVSAMLPTRRPGEWAAGEVGRDIPVDVQTELAPGGILVRVRILDRGPPEPRAEAVLTDGQRLVISLPPGRQPRALRVMVTALNVRTDTAPPSIDSPRVSLSATGETVEDVLNKMLFICPGVSLPWLPGEDRPHGEFITLDLHDVPIERAVEAIASASGRIVTIQRGGVALVKPKDAPRVTPPSGFSASVSAWILSRDAAESIAALRPVFAGWHGEPTPAGPRRDRTLSETELPEFMTDMEALENRSEARRLCRKVVPLQVGNKAQVKVDAVGGAPWLDLTLTPMQDGDALRVLLDARLGTASDESTTRSLVAPPGLCVEVSRDGSVAVFLIHAVAAPAAAPVAPAETRGPRTLGG